VTPAILVTGFQRSGTTLLRRLLCAHPGVKVVLHEARLLRKTMDMEKILGRAVKFAERRHSVALDPGNDAWGDKVPFCTSVPKKGIDYCAGWLEAFGKRAKVLVIVRHPCDVVLSNQRTFSQNPDGVMKAMSLFMPEFVAFGLSDGRVRCLKFEDLVANPRPVLEGVFEFCGLDTAPKVLDAVVGSGSKELRYFERIEPSRAFSYGREPWTGPAVPEPLLESLNRVEGPRYELPVGP
jgi:hypothetical protein